MLKEAKTKTLSDAKGVDIEFEHHVDVMNNQMNEKKKTLNEIMN